MSSRAGWYTSFLGLGHRLLLSRPEKATHYPTGHSVLVCVAELVQWKFHRWERRRPQRKKRQLLRNSFLHDVPRVQAGLSWSLRHHFPHQDKHEVCCQSLLYNLQFQAVLRWIELWVCRDINKPMHLNNLYLPRSSEHYKWWDVAFIFFFPCFRHLAFLENLKFQYHPSWV